MDTCRWCHFFVNKLCKRLEIIVIFTGLNGKIEQIEWGSCMRLNGETEWWACMRLSRGILLEIIVIFTALNGKIEQGEWGSCTRLNGEINSFSMSLNGEPAQGWARQLQTVNCLCVFVKMWEIHGLTFLELKQAVKRLRIELSVVKKKKGVKNQQLRVFLELYLEQCLIALDGAAIRGNLPHPLHPPDTHKYHGFHVFHIFHVLTR